MREVSINVPHLYWYCQCRWLLFTGEEYEYD